VIVLLALSVHVVPPGHAGVVVVLGDVQSDEFSPGLQFKLPWANVVDISVKTTTVKEASTVPSSEGLGVSLDASIIYHLDSSRCDYIYSSRNYTNLKNYAFC